VSFTSHPDPSCWRICWPADWPLAQAGQGFAEVPRRSRCAAGCASDTILCWRRAILWRLLRVVKSATDRSSASGCTSLDDAVVVIDKPAGLLSIGSEREKEKTKILAPYRSDRSFDQSLRAGRTRDGFDLIDLEDTQIPKPPMKPKQWIVIRRKIFWRFLPCDRAIKHPAHGRTVKIGRCNARMFRL
jgi:hypothetical protein